MKNAERIRDDRDILTAKWEIEFEDVHHFKNMYKMAHEFLDEQEWVDPHDGSDKWETYYYENILPNGLKEFRIWWRVVHIPRDNPFIRYFMKVDYLGLVFEKTSTVKDGVKFSTWKGNPIIKCESYLQLDYQDLFKKNKLLSPFQHFFFNRLYKNIYEQHKKELHRRTYQFNRALKQYMGLKTPVDEMKPYRNIKGTPV